MGAASCVPRSVRAQRRHRQRAFSDIPAVLRVTVQQMAASLPGLNSRLLQEDAGVITNGDWPWPLALGVLAGLLIFFGVPFKKLRGRTLGALAGFGLAVWALPALLLACPPAISSPRPLPGSGATFPRQPAPSALRRRRGAAGTAGGPVL